LIMVSTHNPPLYMNEKCLNKHLNTAISVNGESLCLSDRQFVADTIHPRLLRTIPENIG